MPTRLKPTFLKPTFLKTCAVTVFYAAALAAFTCSAARCQPWDQLFAAGRFEDARQAYANEVRAVPIDTGAQVGLVRSLLRLDRWDEAVPAAQAFAAKFPANADAHGLLSLALIRAGWQPPYAEEAKRSLALDPQNYWGLVAAGRAADWDGSIDEARADFRKAAAAHPDIPDAWLGLLETLDDEKDVKEKEAAAAAYLKLSPTGQPHDRRIESLRDFQDNADALRRAFGTDPAFQQVKSTDKDSAEKAKATAQLKFEFVGDYAVFPVTVADRKFRLLFDTGAGDLVLTQGAARRLNLPVLAHSFMRGISGRQRTEVLKANTLTLGGLTYRSIPVETMNFAPASSDGLLGGSTLDDCVITLDYTTGSATLGPAAAPPAPLPGSRLLTLPFRVYRDHLFVQLQLNTVPIWAMLDTGAEQSVFSLRLAAQQLAAVPKDHVHTGSFSDRSGIGDTARQINYIFSRDQSTVTLSRTPPVAVLTETFGESFLDQEVSPDYDFEIGMLFGASSFTYAQRVTFDYPHKQLTFEYADPDTLPNAGAAKTKKK